MQNWEFLPLMAIGMGLLFYMLHYFGLLVVKSGTYTGGAMGTSNRLWGEYRSFCGTVSTPPQSRPASPSAWRSCPAAPA